MPESPHQELEALQRNLEYFFKDIQLLIQALTHRSYTNEQTRMKLKDNERLEFLGDAVLSLTLTDLLLKKYPVAPEGHLSRLRSELVNEKTLARVAEGLDLGGCLRIGKGEERTGGRMKPSLLADTLEALLGAVYLDGGYEAARVLIERLFSPRLQDRGISFHDYKTLLQEYCQGRLKCTPDYRVCGEEGPDHRKTFFIEVRIDGRVVARGRGRTKKAAEQEAAQQALGLLEKDGFPRLYDPRPLVSPRQRR